MRDIGAVFVSLSSLMIGGMFWSGWSLAACLTEWGVAGFPIIR
jgi:hypothetical protein